MIRINRSCPRTKPATRAFTLRDLVTLLGVLVMLASLTAASNGNALVKGQVAICVNNLRQLARAWQVYADDHNGLLADNLPSANPATPGWCVGWLDFSGGDLGADTNVNYLMRSQLGPYAGTPRIYKCPADTSLSRGARGQPRVRSVSMNAYMGCTSNPWTPGYRQFRRYHEIVDPRPAEAFVFIDEREDSINDPCFYVDMSGWRPTDPSVYRLVDFPADWHDGGGTLSFADGHAELWRWQDGRTRFRHVLGQAVTATLLLPNSPDVARIQRATSRPVQ